MNGATEMLDRDQVILILDDDRDITEALAFALERPDRTIITCNDFESAELVVERFHPTVVISDVHLSGEFGFEGLEIISVVKRCTPTARVIMITGDAREKLQFEASQRGAVAFLEKPFDFDEIEAMINLMVPASPPKRLPSRIYMPPLDDILAGPDLTAVYQPIMKLQEEWAPLGYEALARYVSDSPLRSPDLLFQYAARKHRVAELEAKCLRRALTDGARLADSGLLFVNVHHDVLRLGASFRDLLREEARRAGLSLGQIVLELTQQALLTEDGLPVRLFEQLGNDGVKLAFQDGVAHSHLTFIDRIRPAFLKISHNLGTGFETDSKRTKVIRNLVNFAADFNCAVILEGIEDASTARAAQDLGIEYGQGFLFGRPSAADAFTPVLQFAAS